MKKLLRLLLSLSIIVFIGCGGGGSSQTAENNTTETEQINKVADANATILTEAATRSLDFNQSAISESTDTSVIVQKAFDANDTNRPLFIDGDFQGIISKVEKIDENSSKYTFEDADSLDEVYQSVTIDFSSDANLQRSLRTLSKTYIQGKYDYLNPDNPITAYFYTQPNTRGIGNNVDDLILHVDIPQGYKFPSGDHIVKQNIRGSDNYVSCTFDLQACTAKVDGDIENNLDINVNTTINPGFVITSPGSYINYNIGSIVKLSYTNIEHLPNQPTLAFTFNLNAKMDLNLNFEAHGEASKEIVKEYDITGGFALEMYHPGSLIAKTSVHFQPRVEFGASAFIEGTIKATSKVTRDLVINMNYTGTSPGVYNPLIVQTPEQINGVSILEKRFVYNNDAENITEAGLSADIEANAKAWAAPNIAVAPEVKFLRIVKPVYLGEISGRATLEGVIDGKVGASYLINNANGEYDAYAEVGVGVNYFFTLDALFDVKVGDKEWYKSEKKEWYKSEPTEVFDWRIRVLHKPEIEVAGIDNNTKEVTFKTDIDDENISKKIKFYYTTDGSDPVYTDDKNIKGTLWDNNPISITATTVIKVIAVLKNSDISDGIWAFGVSASGISEKEVALNVTITPPTSYPEDGTLFSESSGLDVTLSHELNYAIYYTLDGTQPTTSSTQYTNPINLSTTTTINALAEKEGSTSSVVSFHYYLQEDNRVCSGGTLTSQPTKCYNGEDGCWRQQCTTEVSCPYNGGTKTLSSWSELYEPDSSISGEKVLDHVIFSQLIQQPGGYWGSCTTRQENWSQGNLSRATDYEIYQDANGCWYSDGDLCYQACSYYSFHEGVNPYELCPQTIATTSSSQAASSSSEAQSSSSSSSSSSEASSSSSSTTSSSSSQPAGECGCTTQDVSFTLHQDSNADCSAVEFCQSYFSENDLSTLPDGTHFGGSEYGYPCSVSIYCP